jgi:hypothetical protein
MGTRGSVLDSCYSYQRRMLAFARCCGDRAQMRDPPVLKPGQDNENQSVVRCDNDPDDKTGRRICWSTYTLGHEASGERGEPGHRLWDRRASPLLSTRSHKEADVPVHATNL